MKTKLFSRRFKEDTMTNQALPSTIVFESAEQGMQAFNTANLVFSPVAMQQIQELSSLMATTRGIVPNHFANNPGACFSVVMQAGRWGMDPFSLAQHTFDIGGKLGFEAKVVQAVLQSAGGIKFTAEYNGDWSKVRGKTIERESAPKKPNERPKKYRMPNWRDADEIGLSVTITGNWPDGRKESMTVEMNSCHPRQSTNWANDPEQQVWYSAIKKFGRRFAPELLLGVMDQDDLSYRAEERVEREVNPVDTSGTQAETLSEVMSLNAKEKTEKDQSEPQDTLNEIFDTKAEESAKFFELKDLLFTVKTKDDYREVAPTISEAYRASEISKDEHFELLKLCKQLHSSLNE